MEMSLSVEEKLIANRIKLFKLSMISSPGVIMLGFGLAAKFGPKEEVLHPILENVFLVNVMIIFGAIITVWAVRRAIALSQEKTKLKNEIGK